MMKRNISGKKMSGLEQRTDIFFVWDQGQAVGYFNCSNLAFGNEKDRFTHSFSRPNGAQYKVQISFMNICL